MVTRGRRILRRGLLAAGLIAPVGLGGMFYLHALEPLPRLASAPALEMLSRPAAPTHEWSHFAADAGATQYSALSQITPQNVDELEVAWNYRTGEAQRHAAELSRSSFSNTPILAAGSLIVCTPWSRVIALDPATGTERWVFDPQMTLEQPAEHRYVCRGVAAWHDPDAAPGATCGDRILYGTNDLRIFALDAATGKLCPDFADHGVIRIQPQPAQAFAGELQLNGPPAVVGDVVVFGSTVSDHVRSGSPSGVVRAFDARTGVPMWTFDPIPRNPTDPAQGSWANGSASRHGGANVWADMSVDEARGLIYLSTSSPSLDFDGRDRPGANRYANSIVALDGATGRRAWSFQVVHHDLWDYDLPAAALLTELTVEGERRDAAIQVTKQGLVFVLDRVTGEPLFAVEERPVPPSDVPGEHASPTQPFPTTMPWLLEDGRTDPHFTAEDAWGFTFWDQAKCKAQLRGKRALGLYGPPSREGTIAYPWGTGGSNHGMRAYDPERKLLIANIIRTVGVMVVPPEERPDPAAGQFLPQGHGLVLSPLGAPCSPPPWGELLALDVERQQIVWRVPLGTIEKQAPVPMPIRPRFGTPNRGGPMVTGGGLIFIAATMDDAMRAFDTDTGEELWRVQLPAGGQATPMTYMAGGKQYVVIAAGGHSWMGTTPGDYVIAYSLPDRLAHL